MKPCPIYLHYLDRELRASVGFFADASLVRDTTDVLLAATTSPLYCAISGAWESLDPRISQYLVPLVHAGHLGLVSSHPTQSEFLASRTSLYAHDASRYPMYFGGDPGARINLHPTLIKEESATESLRLELATWAAGSTSSLFFGVEHEQVLVNQVRAAILDALSRRGGEAITSALFSPSLDARSDDPLAPWIVRRLISSAYTKHFRSYGAADIATGIEGLGYYDRLSELFPLHDVPLLRDIFDRLSLRLHTSSDGSMSPLTAVRGGAAHGHFVHTLRRLFGGLMGSCRMRPPVAAAPAARWRLQQELQRILPRANASDQNRSVDTESNLIEAAAWIQSAIGANLSNAQFAAGVEGMEDAISGSTQRVLLVVATKREMLALLAAAGIPEGKITRWFSGGLTFHELGVAGGCNLRVVWTQMGSSGLGGSLQTVHEAIDAWSPTAIIMVGIAFGLREGEQALGHVLVSRSVTSYEHQRVTQAGGASARTPRGPARFPATRRLLDRFLSGQLDWGGAPVHFGILLSGEKLVDSASFKSELLDIEPEAVGGEMEGAGLVVEAYDQKIDWIVVKGIADWGQDKGDSAQDLAAANASEFVMHVIRQGGVSSGARLVVS